ncbi:MAG: hypothetical protein KA260_04665 [Burkholderiales bacterium]|nr:hypothetical protein [Burkholderiales bacterium]
MTRVSLSPSISPSISLMQTSRRHAVAAALLCASIAAVSASLFQSSTVASQVPPPVPRPGEPLPGLTAAQLQAFFDGLDEFTTEETPEGGLGPIFNQKSCVACHSSAAPGGASAVSVTRYGRRLPDGGFDPLSFLGGSLLHTFATRPELQEVIPRQANVIAKRITTPVFGLGLIEAIPDAALLDAAAKPKADGVRGRAAMITDVETGQQRVGRLGWKAQHASVLAFAADAYANEMGVSNRLFPIQNAPNNRRDLLAQFNISTDVEDVVDPATGLADVDRTVNFMRFLAPLPRRTPDASATAGQTVFEQTGCITCHTATLRTGLNAIPALDRKPVPLYSDLLLHDMGSLGDGIAQGAASPREMKTAPLWGLASRPFYLHDGRAPTVTMAIQAHDGEARASRDRFARLPAAQRQQLLDFLRTL